MWRGRHRYWDKHHSALGVRVAALCTGAQYAARGLHPVRATATSPAGCGCMRATRSGCRAPVSASLPRTGTASTKTASAKAHVRAHLRSLTTLRGDRDCGTDERDRVGPTRSVRRVRTGRRISCTGRGGAASGIGPTPAVAAAAAKDAAGELGAARPARRRRAGDPHDLPRQPRRRRARGDRGQRRLRGARGDQAGASLARAPRRDDARHRRLGGRGAAGRRRRRRARSRSSSSRPARRTRTACARRSSARSATSSSRSTRSSSPGRCERCSIGSPAASASSSTASSRSPSDRRRCATRHAKAAGWPQSHAALGQGHGGRARRAGARHAARLHERPHRRSGPALRGRDHPRHRRRRPDRRSSWRLPPRRIRSFTTSRRATTATRSTPRVRPLSRSSSWRRCSAARSSGASGRPARSAERAVRESESALDAATRLQNVADALATAHTPQEVLDAVLTEGVRAAEARGGLIATLSDDGEWLEVIASRGYDMQFIEPFQRFPVSGDFPLSEAVRTGEGVFIRSEAERDERYPELVGRSQPGHGLVCVPLVGERGTIGGLVFSFRPTRSSRPSAGRSRSRSAGRLRSRSSGLGSRSPSGRCASGSPSSARRPRCSPRRSSSSRRSSASPSSRCRCSPTGARSRCSSRRRARSSSSSSPTRIPSASAGPKRCSRRSRTSGSTTSST